MRQDTKIVMWAIAGVLCGAASVAAIVFWLHSYGQ